ncbi:MAG: tetratricopeptide repeat protein, partial [Verrucomicrobiota bacterium]
MKTQPIVRQIVLGLALAGASSAGAEETGKLFQQGLFAEEAEGRLDLAAERYEEVIQRFDRQRDMAVAALYRLAEVRRKQDRKDDAIGLFQRILSEFPKAEPHARLSRENLAAMGVEAAPAGTRSPAPDPEEERELRRLMMFKANTPEKIRQTEERAFNASGNHRPVTPLQYASKQGWFRVAEWLLQEGVAADDNAGDSGYPLYHAAAEGHMRICKLLF